MNAHTEMIKKWESDPKFKKEYDSLANEFAMLDQMLMARKTAGLTQEEVAERMGEKICYSAVRSFWWIA